MWKVQHIICKTRCSSWRNETFQRGFRVDILSSETLLKLQHNLLRVLICVVSNVKVTQRYAKLYQLNHPSLLLTRSHKAFCETPVLPMRSTFTVSYEQHFIFMSLYLAIPRKVSHSLTLAGMEVLLLKPPPLMKM